MNSGTNSGKVQSLIAAALGACLVLYFVSRHLQMFSDVTFLGGILLLEVVILCLWNYEQRVFPLVIVAFVWAGMHVPMQTAWTIGRWVVLSAGAVVGYVLWTKNFRRPFGAIHLIAFFCICAAFVSATVSPYVQMASFKAASLALLFLYCSAGARVAMIGREQRFFDGLLLAVEIVVYITAICYLVLGMPIWGNPNSLGTATSIGLFPILLWGWLTSNDKPLAKMRMLGALLVCGYLVFFSMARAGMITITLVTLIFCICLRQYKLLVRFSAAMLVMVAVAGMLAPQKLDVELVSMKDAFLYKGHKSEGMLGSRLSPWQKSINTIKEHPLFGTGYGTSPTGEDPGLDFGKFASSSETSREHGSSYMTIAEWVGVLGVLPFVALLFVTARNVWKVCAWMKRTGNPRHYSIPLAMVVLSGLFHAGFEDWLFAVGSYPCPFFWVFAFLLADLVPGTVTVPLARVVSRVPVQAQAGFAVGVPNSAIVNR
ncbi:MAG TPA: O-antigen ligase family protein [Terriglobales bacterium]|nr:O-antigen ligase family protein [Terriglobales bacterium]